VDRPSQDLSPWAGPTLNDRAAGAWAGREAREILRCRIEEQEDEELKLAREIEQAWNERWPPTHKKC